MKKVIFILLCSYGMIAQAQVTKMLIAKDTAKLRADINVNTAQSIANAAAIQQRPDSLRNNGGVLEARKNNVFVPQFTLPASPNIYSNDGSLTSARTLNLNSQPLTFAGTTSSRFFANGNVGIGTTTDAGYKLDVNGTAKINAGFGNITFTNQSGYQTAMQASSHLVLSAVNSFEIYNTTGGQNLYLGSGGRVYLGWAPTPNSLGGAAIGYNFSGLPPNSSGILDIKSITSGLLIPRMSTTQKLAIATPAEGLEVYDLTLHQKSYFNGTIWINL